jgi:hypothetical protein
MAYLPQLNDISASRDMISSFRGYNHSYQLADNEFYDMKNMSSRNYPALSPRVQRGGKKYEVECIGLHAHEKLCVVQGITTVELDNVHFGSAIDIDGNIITTDSSSSSDSPAETHEGWLYYGGELITTKLSQNKKTMVNMGAKVLIWPDKVVFNTADKTVENLENTITTSGSVKYQLCKVDTTDYQTYTTSDSAPSDPTDGQLWMNTSTTPHVLMQYSVLYLSWQSIPTTYIKLSATGIGKGFKAYDAVTISGATDSNMNGDFILYGCTDDFIVITGIVDNAGTDTAAITIKRTVPDMDFVCEHNNRIWGCNSEKHEIYACKLGDPTNWNYFTDQSTASYAATVGSVGDFTGCISHGGYVLFFKENEIITLHGNKPSNFQLDYAKCRGVEKGSEKSLVVVNETLYYKSVYDVCAYGSTSPTPVSEALGKTHYKNAVAGALGSIYYISMEDDSGEHWLFSYDDKLGLWHKHDNTSVVEFATLGQELYFMEGDADANGWSLVTMNGTTSVYDETLTLESPVEWYATTGDIGMGLPNNKYISKLQFRLEVPEGSLVRIELEYDSSGQWVEKYRINPTKKRSITVPIIPRRCDHMKVRISGVGDCTIYSFTRTVEEGSEV